VAVVTRRTRMVQPRTRYRFPVEVTEPNPLLMAAVRKLARRPGVRLRVIDARTAIIENVSPWGRNVP
jgi:hypothetical protein